MKKLQLLFLILILLIPLTSCFQPNETFDYNKRVLDDNYEANANYAVITGRTYQTSDDKHHLKSTQTETPTYFWKNKIYVRDKENN